MRFITCFIFCCLFTFNNWSVLAQELPTMVYDKKGNLTQRNRVNYFGKLENDFYGIAIIRYQYDRKGNLIQKSYFDKNDKPFIPDTITSLPEYPTYTLFKYNKDNKLIEVSQHGPKGGYLDLESHSAVKKYVYNHLNQLSEEYNFNKKGKLRGVGTIEVALVKYSYLRNRLSEKKSYDANKKILDFGLSIAQYSYDSLNRINRVSFFFANSDLFLTDRFYYNSAGQLVKEEAYKKDGKLDYTLKYTYNGSHLLKREYSYFNKTSKVEKHGIEVDVPGWKCVSIPNIDGINDIDGTGSFLITIDKNGIITEIKKSYGANALAYACLPYIRKIKLVKDDKATNILHRGEIKIGILNVDPAVEEF
jgi:hypothetical protein